MLYKYRCINEQCYDILKNSRLFLSSPSSFNDPFDAQTLPHLNISDDELKEWCLDEMKKYDQEFQKKVIKTINSGDYKRDEAKEMYLKGYGIELNEFGICSLSQTPNNNLLWSHYADRHKGICIGLSIDKLQELGISLVPVHYSSERLNFSINEKLHKENLRRKYLCWEYEKEVRIIQQRSAGSFIDLPDHSITEIIMGIRTTQDDLVKLHSWINWERQTPTFYQAVEVAGDFELHINEIFTNERPNKRCN